MRRVLAYRRFAQSKFVQLALKPCPARGAEKEDLVWEQSVTRPIAGMEAGGQKSAINAGVGRPPHQESN